MTNPNEMMTPGQMKQLIRRLTGSVPTNLTHTEAQPLMMNSSFEHELRRFWYRVRKQPHQPPSVFPIYVNGESVIGTMQNHHIEIAHSIGIDVPACLQAMDTSMQRQPRSEALELMRLSALCCSAREPIHALQQAGYISASLDEMVAFAVCHGDFVAASGQFFNVLVASPENQYPVLYYDDMEECLKIGFDGWGPEYDFTHQANEITLLVKKGPTV